jgi:hypothetical protein
VQQQREQLIRTSPRKHIRIPIKIPSLTSLRSLRRSTKERPPRDDISSTMSASSQPSGSGSRVDGVVTRYHEPTSEPLRTPQFPVHMAPLSAPPSDPPPQPPPQVSSSSVGSGGHFSFPSPRPNVARWNPRDGLEWSVADIHRAREGPPVMDTARWWDEQQQQCTPQREASQAGSCWQTDSQASASGSIPEQGAGFQRFQILRRAGGHSPEDEGGDDDGEETRTVIRRVH